MTTAGPWKPLTHFPVLVVFSNSVDGSDFSYADFSGTTGYDLRFTEDNGTTEINYEVEGAWVRRRHELRLGPGARAGR